MAQSILMVLGNALGPHPRAMKEISTLLALGHGVTVLEWDRSMEYPRAEVLPNGVRVERIHVPSTYGIPAGFPRLLVFGLSLLRFNLVLGLRILRRDFDLLWAHDFDTLLPAVAAARLKRKRVVYDIHDLYFSFIETKGRPNAASRLIFLVETRAMRLVDRVFVACRSIGGASRGIMEYYLDGLERPRDRGKVEVLWNFPLASFPSAPATEDGKLTLGYIGPLRNCDAFMETLLSRLERHRDRVRLLFVDYGSEIEKLKRLASGRYASLDIRILPRVSYAEAKRYFLMCDAVILSLYPAFALRSKTQRHTVNMKYFEAASLGVPCIAWENTLSADFVRTYGNGFVFEEAVDMDRVLKEIRQVKARAAALRQAFVWERQEEVIAGALGPGK